MSSSRKHRYDQHFLRSPRLVAELIGHSNLRAGDLVYDLGAGSGVITSALARRVRHVVAVEHEPTALAKLRANTRQLDNVELIEGDMMNVALPAEPYSVFANPPFSLISPLVRRLAYADNPPESVYLITQKQFARKTVPSERHFTSALGVQLWPWYAARIRRPLRKTDFTPPPAVDTVLLELRRREQPLLPVEEAAAYCDVVAACYSDRRRFRALWRVAFENDPEAKPSEVAPARWLLLYAATTATSSFSLE